MLPDGRTFQNNVAPMGLNTSGMVLCQFVIMEVIKELVA
jgi:hypothetical protein